MSKVAVFFATGHEEIEALTVVDLLRRAGIETNMISITSELQVNGAHNIMTKMDKLFEEEDFGTYDIVVLPGGMPGTTNLEAYEPLMKLLKERVEQNRMMAAICAAPTVFGHAGFLKGKRACCFPGKEDGLIGAEVSYNEVEVDGNIITSRGLGTAIPFALKLIELLQDEERATALGKKIVYRLNA